VKRIICWLLGHRMVAITDKDEIRYWLDVWLRDQTKRCVMVKCGRCGAPIIAPGVAAGKGTIVYDVGEESYFLRFPDGRIERVVGLFRFLWLAAWLILRGYQLRERQ
jgi:hypothetical protein